MRRLSAKRRRAQPAGNRIPSQAWGFGYATELATECTAVADTVLQRSEVHAFARPDNAGSRRVLEKAGFAVVRFVPELKRLLYRRVREAGRNA